MVVQREKDRRQPEGHTGSATVLLWWTFRSKMVDQAHLLPLHPGPPLLLPAPLCSRGCGNLASIPSPSPPCHNPLFSHIPPIIHPLPALGFHSWSGLTRGKSTASVCLQPAHARIINTHFAVLIWVPFKLKAVCCSVPACLAGGKSLALAPRKLEATHA